MIADNHCLVVTHHSLTQLTEKKHGIYRRFFMFLEAIHRLNIPITIFTLVTPADKARTTPPIETVIADEILSLWGLNVRIHAIAPAHQDDRPWLFQQISGIRGYTRSALYRSLFSTNVLDELQRLLAKKPAFVFAHRLTSMVALSTLSTAPETPIFFDLDDIEHVAQGRGIKYLSSTRNKIFEYLYFPTTFFAERKAIRRATQTYVCSPLDVEKIKRIAPHANVTAIQNAVDIPDIELAVAQSSVLLIVGMYAYGPNADAADYFIEDIFPIIKSNLPSAELWLVGKGVESLRTYQSKPANVRFIGFVPDLATVYKQARVVVCPIRHGGGTRVKLVEAAAWGKPIVSTTVGAEGLGLEHGKEILLADTSQDFANACLSLLKNDGLCRSLSRNAYSRAVSSYKRGAIVDELAHSVTSSLKHR